MLLSRRTTSRTYPQKRRPPPPADAIELDQLLTSAFGQSHGERLGDPSERTLLVEFKGATVGTLRLTRNRDVAGVYGFAVDPSWQHRGIGRDVLRRVCRQVRDEGARSVELEVAIDNDRALGLYTSVGFALVTTEDYYELRLAARCWTDSPGVLPCPTTHDRQHARRRTSAMRLPVSDRLTRKQKPPVRDPKRQGRSAQA